ncbi:COX15/CtaA family protein [Parahaliea mediterranea]|uniref:COX15/CtaA family protein n=1 Tax=Parahaliea mediterranea TaxID=651086 RepID=A0A939DCH4_9GAMM|nr:COX15/CtaA family protein [Parahaliea mediterranea]MBN7795698.1 COX15/CtaA family protein [Parahaliea mediterranea]
MLLSHRNRQHDRQVAAWLLLCAAVVFGMILLGGVTRLTNSGLSMVEWKPLMGVVPPLSEQAWQETFDKYKAYPEYRKINRGMDLDGFKSIFMYEYLHRLLGRLIGVLFFFPMVYFMMRRRVPAGLQPKLWLLFLLGGGQGLLGWFMVKSGLVSDPHVSQYRLAAHMGLAVIIYAYMLWLVFDLRLGKPRRGTGAGPLARTSLVLVGLVYLMILSGALVAGTKAGFAYSTWPLMGTSFFPPGLYAGDPAWLDAFEDITAIQFNHRMFAYFLIIVVAVFATLAWRRVPTPRVRLGVILLGLALAAQVLLGISTLLLHVPVSLAAAHQGGAVLLLSAALFVAHALRRQTAVAPAPQAP